MRELRTNWRGLGLCMAAGAGLVLSGCGDNQDPSGAAKLWSSIRQPRYRSFERAPGYEERRNSNAPHGGSVDIYINDVVAEALDAGAPLDEWPIGSLIVKDGFDEGDLELVAAMEKQDGGWFWAEWDDEGDAIYSGSPDVCTDCHASGDDFVRAFSFPTAQTP